MFLNICFFIYALYTCNDLKKCKIQKNFKLILNNTNVNLK